MKFIQMIQGFVKLRGKSGNTVTSSLKEDGTTEAIHTISQVGTETLPAVVTSPQANKSSFGDNLSESLDPIAQISAIYGITEDVQVFSEGTGSYSEADNMFEISTGVTANSRACLRTRRAIIYREGQGLQTRLTSQFDPNPVADSVQFAGFFNISDRVGFGYSGVDYGIIYDSYGKVEICDLQITASGSGNLTLTLNSVVYIIPITAGTVNHNAYEIATWMRNNQTQWNTQQIDDTVTFSYTTIGARSGTYSISGTTLTGIFTLVSSGEESTKVFIPRTSWDVDTTSWLDPDDINVYMLKLAYLGVGPFYFFVVNKNTNEFVLVHTITHIGARNKPSLSKRTLKSGWLVQSTGSTTDITVKGASAGMFIEGKSKTLGNTRTTSNTNISVGSVFEAILTIQTKEVFNSKTMLGRIFPIILSIASTSAKPTEFTLIKNATYGETNFIPLNDGSIALFDTSGGALVGSPLEAFSCVLSSDGATTLNIGDLDLELELTETITIFARKTSGTNPEVTASLVWKEDF